MFQVIEGNAARATSPNRPDATTATRIAGCCILLLFAATGCSKSPTVEHLTEALEASPPHSLPVSERSLKLISMKPEKTAGHWTVEFECEETARTDWLAATDAASQIDPSLKQQADAARESLPLLRSPENTGPIEQQRAVEAFRFPKLFAPVCRAGKTIQWRGTGLLTRKEGEYQLTTSDMQFPDEVDVAALQTKDQLPAESAIVNGDKNDPVYQYHQLLKQLSTGVARAETAMQARLAREHEMLLEVIASEKGLSGDWAMGRPTKNVSVQLYLESDENDESLSGLIVDGSDPFNRAVFLGALKLPEMTDRKQLSARAIHDGWSISLENADRKLSEFAGKMVARMSVFADADKGTLRLADPQHSAPLEVMSEERPSIEKLSAFVREGMNFTGREIPPDSAGRTIAAAVTRLDPETGLIRVVVEDAKYPFAFSIFEGRSITEHPHHLGFPVRLKLVEVARLPYDPPPLTPLFPGRVYGELVLLPTESGFRGTFNRSRVELDSGVFNELTIDAARRWPTSLPAGSRWTGSVKMGDDPAEPVTMRVAEMRHGGEYVRLLMERDTDAAQFVVYEGAVVARSERIDGYGLVTTQRGSATHSERQSRGVYFSRSAEQSSPWFRLSADGKQLFSKCDYGESMMLTRDESVTPSDGLTTTEFLKAWATALTVGTVWKGKLVNPGLDQTGEILIKVQKFENNGQTVALEITPADLPSVVAFYEGSLNASDDLVNGFGLILKKVRGTAGESTVLGAGNIGSQLQFRLTPDRKQLIGRTWGQVRFEYLELSSVVED